MNLTMLEPRLKQRGLNVVHDLKTMAEIVDFRTRKYSELYPAVKNHGPDLFDLNGIVLFSRNRIGNVSTTARIAFNVNNGLPSAALLHLRLAHVPATETLCEIGKFIIGDKSGDECSDESTGPQLHDYFRAFYQIGCSHRLIYAFLVPQNHGGFYTQHVGAQLVLQKTGETFGSADNFSIFIWRPAESTARFKQWIGTKE